MGNMAAEKYRAVADIIVETDGKSIDEICDEIWYVYASVETRKKRLSTSRSYSEEKFDAIAASQHTEEEFRAKADEVIDNDRSPDESYSQIYVIMQRKAFRQFLTY